MKKIVFSLLSVLAVNSAVHATNTVVAVQRQPQTPELSTPENAFRCAMRGFETADVDLLKTCLSRRLIVDMCGEGSRPKAPEAYIKMWQECISRAGGYQRPIVRVTFLPEQGANTNTTAVRRAHVKLKPVEGFQDFSLMVFEDGGWKFDER